MLTFDWGKFPFLFESYACLQLRIAFFKRTKLKVKGNKQEKENNKKQLVAEQYHDLGRVQKKRINILETPEAEGFVLKLRPHKSFFSCIKRVYAVEMYQ